MRRYFFCFVLFLGTVHAQHNEKSFAPQVTLSLGKVRGSLMKTRLNRTIYSFRSIRFAEPAVGDLRFRPAVPVKPWNETVDASQDLPGCPQKKGEFSPSEDCLRLNVYTTKLPSTHSNVSRPVIVFFHPGSFAIGSAGVLLQGPNYLLDHDVVLVLPNYRLSALGPNVSLCLFSPGSALNSNEAGKTAHNVDKFCVLGLLSTGDALAPGNLALKDQVVALHWVQKHIEKFGGDPNLVTIAGYSAGARSVSLHLLSPMSKGLFHRAIVSSAAVTNQNPLPHHQKDLAIKQARLLGCPSDTSENIINCLRNKTAEEIGNSSGLFKEWNWDPMVVWSPVVEPDIPGVERFLTAQPVDLIREGKFHHVPVMAGMTETEFGPFVIRPVSEARNGNNSLFDDYNANWTRIAPISFNYERNTTRSIKISEELKKFYLHNEPVSCDNWEGLAQLYCDGGEAFAMHRLVNVLAPVSTEPVWYYKFTYQGRYSMGTWPDGKLFKPSHMDDLMHIFYMSDFFPYFEDGAPELGTVRKLTAIWANFAKYGEPIPKNNELFRNVTWPAFTLENKEYLNMGNEFVVETGLYQDRMNKWEELFPLNHCLSDKRRK